MSKYDKYIEEGKESLKDLASKWKGLIGSIKTKESEKWQLEKEKASLINEIKTLEEKLEILEKAPKTILKRNIFLLSVIIFIISIFVITTNMAYVTEELSFMDVFLGKASAFNIWMLSSSSCLAILFCNMSSSDIRKIKKEYTLDSLTEQIQSKKEQKEHRESRMDELTKKLDKLYEEKEELKNMIMSLNTNLSELEKNRIATIESLVPNIESSLDERFDEAYGKENPLGVMRLARVKEGD